MNTLSNVALTVCNDLITSGYIAPVVTHQDGQWNITSSTYEYPSGLSSVSTNDNINSQALGITFPTNITTSNWFGTIGQYDTTTGGYAFPPLTPALLDLDSLEEGIYDIKGGKIIIKKIKVTEEELEDAIQEVLGPDATEEEKIATQHELEELSVSEERYV